jgi:D-arabinose 1-dehydrogenase-like Zn-dependent alcohol dehydrogenase
MTGLLSLINMLLAVRGRALGFTPPPSNPFERNNNGRYFVSSTQLFECKYNSVFVAGGTRGVGRHIIDKLVESGSSVVALARTDEAVENLQAIKGVTAVKGDAFVQNDLKNAMSGCDAAISTLGGSTGDKRVDYEGNANVIESAGILGVTRMILVTSVGCVSKLIAPQK